MYAYAAANLRNTWFTGAERIDTLSHTMKSRFHRI